MKKPRTIYGSGSSALTPTPVIQPSPADWPSDAAVIYRELLWWRDRALAAEKLYHSEQKRFTKYRARGLARGIAKRLTPNHDPKDGQK